ncbi:hypothetical protein ONZ45_g13140 [Pleurotus djamor]|nr:hypothetical protein ONZ45_g13140 [Pleurotus djamor]
MTLIVRELHLDDILPNIEESLLRPLFFGLIASAILYGVVNLQAYRYFIRYTKDPLSEKLAVALLSCTATASMALVLYTAYFTLVQAWANSAELLDPILSRQVDFEALSRTTSCDSVQSLSVVKFEVICDIFVVNCVHTLYANKAWRLSSRLHWTFHSAIALVIVGELGADIFAVVQLSRPQSFIDVVNYNVLWERAIYTIFLAATFTDLFMALAICYSLRQSSSEFSRTQSKISILIKYTVSSGLLTSFIDLAALITVVSLLLNSS